MITEILTRYDTPWRTPPEMATVPLSHDESVHGRLGDAVRQEEKRRHLLRILQSPTPPWNPADHPEIEEAGGAAAWVKKLRREAEQGFEKRTRPEERG